MRELPVDQRIIDLKSTTFSGRRLNRQQIADSQETVELLPNDSRNELAKTICEHPGWTTAKGDYRVGACLGMLETLETLEGHGILTLPPVREDSVRDMKAVDASAWTSASDPQPEIAAPLSDLCPLRVELVTDTAGRQLWNAFENNNHRQHDCNFGEDACLTHTGNGPLNRPCLNTIALAVIFATRRKGAGVIETTRRFALDRDNAIRVVCEPPSSPEV